MESLAIGLLGLGTVGSGVARILRDSHERVTRRAGRRLVLKTALVRDGEKDRGEFIDASAIVTDPALVLRDPAIRVILEVMGGLEPARTFVLEALARGKDVVTANKALLADHGPEIVAQARKYGRCVAFEASVGGGIPIVHALAVSLAANQVMSLAAILNGTCNFILTAMTRDGLSYETALGKAQELGYAEADPTLDVDGTDTAHKLAILAQIAFGASVTTRDIPRVGIDQLHSHDLRYAAELGYGVKLLALAKYAPSGLELRVAPTLVKLGTPLAEVRGPYNAVRVVGDAVGDTLFYGRGAGSMPTASAVVGDLIDVVIGRSKLTFDALNLWPEDAPSPRLASSAGVRSRYYLRFSIADEPGVLGSIAERLGNAGISIASVIQHDPGEHDAANSCVSLVVMTHVAVESKLHAALAEIDRLPSVKSPSVCLGVEE